VAGLPGVPGGGTAGVSPSSGPVHVRSRKWPDRPHWEFGAVWLGEDEHGDWVGAPTGTAMRRPGAAFLTDRAQVTLVPRDEPFLATFYAPGGISPFEVYVDITTVPTWTDGPVRVVSMVDLDLDVIRGWTGRVWVDDEDEFAAHRVSFAYPADVVRLAATSCAAVRVAVEGGRPPYDGSAGAWLAVLETTVREP
jgi:uncharacterized protein